MIGNSGSLGLEHPAHHVEEQPTRKMASDASAAKSKTSAHTPIMRSAAEPKRRGALQPPAPAHNSKVAKRAKSSTRKETFQAKAPLPIGKTGKKNARAHKSRKPQTRQSADGWKFRGPKPLPVLEDHRLSDKEKKLELERLMEKLHYEFWLKKDMGHSRLKQARDNYYKTLADYSKLTGVAYQEHFELEALPEVQGISEIQEDEVEEADEASSLGSAVLCGNSEPTCLGASICVIPSEHQQLCEDAKVATQAEEQYCPCYRYWQQCALTLSECGGPGDGTQFQPGHDDYAFYACLASSETETCTWGQNGQVPTLLSWNHMIAPDQQAVAEPPNNGDLMQLQGSQNVSDVRRERLEQDMRGHGFVLDPLLERREGKDPPGTNNAPPNCEVSNPEMLGDGNCDGGAYNTESCNYDGGDCCDSDCRPALHHCGMGGYACQGTRVGVAYDGDFKCDTGKLEQFKTIFETMRDELTLGNARQETNQCDHLTKEEHNNVVQAFNSGVLLGYYADVVQASAVRGGPNLYVNCKLWDEDMNSNPEWFGSLVSHEMGHAAGYSHPKFSGQTYESECENIGSDYCHGHCMEWTSACENHMVFGSESCGFAGFGCKTTCVHSDYCFSLPERVTECLNYMKVHSRADQTFWEKTGNTVSCWFGFDCYAPRCSVMLPMVMVLLSLLMPAVEK
jgi:hypothetical protein